MSTKSQSDDRGVEGVGFLTSLRSLCDGLSVKELKQSVKKSCLVITNEMLLLQSDVFF